jgi:hypothetical protein
MSATSGYYNPAGQGWRLAYSLVTLAHELASVYGDQLTCLGTVGDAVHATENMSSDHNPFVRDPAAPSIGIVRAIDFGGPNALLMSVREHIWTLYAARDSRVYGYGYAKGCSDNLINNWGLPFGTHVDTGDAGHLHISVTQVNGNNPSAGGYVAAIDSTAPWGFAGLTPSGGGTPIPEDEMTAADVWGFGIPVPGLGPAVGDTAGDLLATIRTMLSTIESQNDTTLAAVKAVAPTVDINALATAIVKQLPSTGTGPTADDIAKLTVALLGQKLGATS